MIKTMLLTAQLALSPIVGTNGLQPKHLPNPVYGESVDYSVTYEGKTYTRLAYVNEQTDWIFDNMTNGYSKVTFTFKGIENSGANGYYTTLGSGDRDTAYLSIESQDGDCSVTDHNGFSCLALYALDRDNNNWQYFELFKDNEGELHQLSWTWSGSNWEKEDEEIPNYTWAQWSSKAGNNIPKCTLGYIPQFQPTTANPSVYDNIYNFYYQNLFANEALDELGAKVGNNSMTMRQWLAHTATIVSISLLAAALVILVIKIFKLIAGSISDIWG